VLSSPCAFTKVLNKILANVENSSLTLLEANREIKTYSSKKTISPQLYKRSKVTLEEVVNSFIKRNIIRLKLKEVGYEITNDQVESQIKSTESRLGLGRKELLSFLKSNGLTFNEYFETTRESIEYNIFLGKIIKPLVKITEQEIIQKYKENSNNDSLTYEYGLVDFYIETKKINKISSKTLHRDLTNFKKNGILPVYLQEIKTNVIKQVSEENLSKKIKEKVKVTKKNKFTKPIAISGVTHLFFIKEKKLIESAKFRNQKPLLSQMIFEKKSGNVIKAWVNQNKKNFYISLNL
jgi:peptidyl-prolyl cis-trans isomerase SurA